ncbi:uncharacterized protein LOC143881348 [Tasmannia lanceolata]|uniref:uncharacterized protein LOC143881348 n=1 Tax=Tasmannia lanceolata TaxID=3420 RepID=UPI004062D566
MDDSCAVCAEPLEWVAYGPCGHREVCSTCVVRLRFVIDDPRCCICKTESSTVFVTKALGDYTRMIADFSIFPTDGAEGKVGPYWYHEDTQSYFDDVDHYKMIKAMCKLSCSICDKHGEEHGNDGTKRRDKFKNIEQLKSHLFHRHKKLMCTLCLEGRKVFICEQKLYTRAQLNQHISTGDSEVDGSESERGGFMGHPMCEFCRNPFYGENELYLHMSTEHYTCHICQRQHPGQFDYYKNYDDLEIHFRQEHFLCEDEACLHKKFVVFQSESEMKRHNAVEHGGHMSRSKRNAALQIPTSFRYRRTNENDQRRGRGRGFHRDSSDNQLSLAIQASFEAANTDNTTHDPPSNVQQVSDNVETSDIDSAISPFESLAISQDSEPASRYLQAVSQGGSRTARLEESSFPPLPVVPNSNNQIPSHDSEGLGKNTMAARLRLRNKVTVLSPSQTKARANRRHVSSSSSLNWPTENSGLVSSGSSSPAQSWPAISSSAPNWPTENPGLVSSSSSSPAQSWPAINPRVASSSSSSSALTRQAKNHGLASSSSSSSVHAKPTTNHGLVAPSSGTSSWNSSTISRISHSMSAPNLVDRGSSNLSGMVSGTRIENHMVPTSSQPLLKVEDVHTANKSLVERIREGLGMDENKYAAFKEISAEYRQGVIDTWEYLSYVQQFGLSHLVLELARLCPDPQKQRELIETYNANFRINDPEENGGGNNASKKESANLRSSGPQENGRNSASKKESSGSIRGKGVVDGAGSSTNETLADSVINTVRILQASYKPSEEVEVLSRGGYRSAKGKSKASVFEEQSELSSANGLLADSNGGGSNQSVGGGGNNKQKRKTSKFLRARLGDGSLLDLRNSDASLDDAEETTESQNSSDGLPVRGVWRNGGGHRLVAKTQSKPAN